MSQEPVLKEIVPGRQHEITYFTDTVFATFTWTPGFWSRLKHFLTGRGFRLTVQESPTRTVFSIEGIDCGHELSVDRKKPEAL